jgi:hypothetical protein
MATAAKVKDLVVVIPGALGSRLFCAGQPLWGYGATSFLQWLQQRGGDLAPLALGGDDPTVDDLGDGIRADGVIESPLVVGRFLKISGYGPLLHHLERTLRLRRGENLRIYAYDWRRDLRVAVRRFSACVEGWLREWRERSGQPDAKIVLIGHAMGGLVARHWVDVEDGWRSVRRIIAIGTPYLGSIRALDVLYFGLDLRSYGLPLHDLTPIARTLTSLYQLLPQYPSIRTFAGHLVSPFEVRIPTFDHQKMERARQFHRDLVDHHHRTRAQPGYSAMASTVIAGVGQPTVEEARLLPNGMLSVEQDVFEQDADGDGSIPRFSAEAETHGSFQSHSIYVPQLHGALASDPAVHFHLGELLREGRSDAHPDRIPLPRFTLRRLADGRLRVHADALSLHVARPYYRAGQTIELRVAARTATGDPFDARAVKLRLGVEAAGSVAKRARVLALRASPIRGRPGWFAAKLKAPAPGTYRVTAASTDRLLSTFPVSDLFEVY